MPLRRSGIAGEELDVPGEQLLDARPPFEAQIAQALAALGDVHAGILEAPAHRLERRSKAEQAGVHDEVPGRAAPQLVDPP
jgi:hypothetical protein